MEPAGIALAIVTTVAFIVGAVVLLRFVFVTLPRRIFGGVPRAKGEPETYVEDDMRPATERQLDFIDRLIEEREIDPKILEMPCERLTDASKMIEALLACPKPGKD